MGISKEKQGGILTRAVSDLELVKYLIEEKNFDVDARNKYGHTALMSATPFHKETIKYLISKGANVNIKSDRGKTAFKIAADCRSLPVLKLLIEAGCEH